jgi:hypothetical protein
MVLGRSSQGKVLLRGWHLNGWSVSNKRHIKKYGECLELIEYYQ